MWVGIDAIKLLSAVDSRVRIRLMEIRLHATLRQIVGARIVAVETHPGQTAGDALRALVAAHPALASSIWHDDGTLAGHVAVILDGRDIRHLSGVDTPLGEAKHLDVFPPVGGG
jgi:molybdopterin synthase sulfur carrier subunit